ncbi:hypothetical protein AVEN_212868-1 [Araneus ventricosus]|uniref:Uncharacterized protein n=1 Tax=Araneus ventricosus TaxID=182803 RepID=A0A4Y2F6T2_ARAVE|nr:hypothetical protein AVEN_212868-1 [Araneus ventricosus]
MARWDLNTKVELLFAKRQFRTIRTPYFCNSKTLQENCQFIFSDLLLLARGLEDTIYDIGEAHDTGHKAEDPPNVAHSTSVRCFRPNFGRQSLEERRPFLTYPRSQMTRDLSLK